MGKKADTDIIEVEETRPSLGMRFLYFLIAFIVVLPPVYLYASIFGMSLTEHGLLFAVIISSSAFVVSLAYHNVTFCTKIKEDIRPKEKLGKQEIKAMKEQQAFYTGIEAGAYSVLYNNVFYLILTCVLGFFLFTPFTPEYNFVLTSVISSAVLSFTSAKSLSSL